MIDRTVLVPRSLSIPGSGVKVSLANTESQVVPSVSDMCVREENHFHSSIQVQILRFGFRIQFKSRRINRWFYGIIVWDLNFT